MNFGIFRRMLGILSNFYAFVSSHVIILEKIPLFNSKTTYSTIDARYSMTWKKLFTLNSAWAAFDAYLHHSIFFTDANLHHFA